MAAVRRAFVSEPGRVLWRRVPEMRRRAVAGLRARSVRLTSRRGGRGGAAACRAEKACSGKGDGLERGGRGEDERERDLDDAHAWGLGGAREAQLRLLLVTRVVARSLRTPLQLARFSAPAPRLIRALRLPAVRVVRCGFHWLVRTGGVQEG